MASSTRKKAPTRAKAARRAAVPAPNPPPAIDPAPPAQASQQRSPWKAVAIVIGALAVLAVVFGAGATAGYSYGRMGGLIAVRGNITPFGFMMPFGGRLQPYDNFERMPHDRLGPLGAGTAYLGVTFGAVDPSLAEQQGLSLKEGAQVSEVIEGSPADGAGLQPGDIILAVDGHRLTHARVLRRLIQAHLPGDEVSLLILRAGEEMSVVVRLGRAPDSPSP